MTLERLARHRPPLGGDPDTEVVQEILTQVFQVEISYFVSGEHDTHESLAEKIYCTLYCMLGLFIYLVCALHYCYVFSSHTRHIFLPLSQTSAVLDTVAILRCMF